jgi:hypothetical protein
MKLPLLLLGLAGLILGALVVRYLLAPRQPHDPVEYFLGWGGYTHPIGLQHRITKLEAEALGAQGAVYLVGHFDGDSRLMQATKFYRGEVFFDYVYAYHPNGRLKSATVARGGHVTVLEFDARGRAVPGTRTAF